MVSRKYLLALYAPTFLLSVSDGLLIPVLPVYAQSMGASFIMVSLVIGAAALGTLLADVPAGVVLERFGRKSIMLVGTGALALCMLAMGLAQSIPQLAFLRVVAGLGTALWAISRMAYVAEAIPLAGRGRVLSAFGGTSRIGVFIGPATGGLLADRLGLSAPFYLASMLAAVAAILAGLAVEEDRRRPASGHRKMRWHLLGYVVRQQWRDLATAGGTQIVMSMVRTGRQLIIPLYGTSVLGLDVVSVGTIVSIASAIDMSLFVPAGMLMDRFGRKFAIVPSLTIMALGMALIPISRDYVSLLVATATLGLGNGIGAGTMMTLGSDLAPKEATGEFLGIWRFIGDSGGVAGPMMVGTVADIVGLSASALSLAGIGVVTAGAVTFLVRETLHRQRAPVST